MIERITKPWRRGSSPTDAVCPGLFRAVGLVITGLLPAACSSLDPDEIVPDPTAPVQSSAARYRLVNSAIGHEIEIPWTYVNRGLIPIFHARCADRLEKRAAQTWSVAFQVICPQSGQRLDTIPPGTSFTGSLQVRSCLLDNCSPRLADPVPGVYRLIVALYRSTEVVAQITFPRDSLAVDDRRSNAFWIDLPE